MALPIALVVAAYLLGSVSFGLLIARARGVDLRAVGSGNIGATNVGRALGKRTGRFVLVLDALKGALPVLAARWLLGSTSPWTAGVGVAAVVGHLVPVWHGFRGGKGAATGLGVMLAAEPIAGAAAAVTYVLGKALTKRASVGSMLGAVVGCAVAWWLAPLGAMAWMATAIGVLVLVAHAPNLARLAKGEEPPS